MSKLRLGYLLPTREAIMQGAHAALPIVALAERAEAAGLDSVWLGDSLLAKPRHEPLVLLAAIAARTRRVELGTAVLLPMLRNPTVLAHQVATLDQIAEGRLILGVGTARDVPRIRVEFEAAGVPFEKRIGRMLEQLRLCRAFWRGEPVDWDGRWRVEAGELAPVPHRPGGPPVWGGGSVPGALRRAGRYFEGWFPSGPPDAATWRQGWQTVRAEAEAAGRDPGDLTGASYLTLVLDEDRARGERRLNAYLEGYYGQPADVIRGQQGCFAGPPEEGVAWLRGYVEAGVRHLIVRFTGEHERNIELLAGLRGQITA